MPNMIILGTQWGDEGKGKIVDYLAEKASVVARFQGGANAGHTLKIDDKKYVLHLVPSGIITGKKCIIGQGLVVDYNQFVNEIRELRLSGVEITPENLILDGNAHVIMPYHRVLDMIKDKHIGTTGRGIGPAYEDKANRTRAIRVNDLFSINLKERLEKNIEFYNNLFDFFSTKHGKTREEVALSIFENNPSFKIYFDENFYLSVEAINNDLENKKLFVQQFVKTDESKLVIQTASQNKSLLAEGAQGTMLCVDNGTYPFVTSSNTGLGGAINGLGVYVDYDYRIGIVKAYTTRVGGGPFPTELFDEYGEQLRKQGGEFGATTGRPRRCGWFDVAVVKKSIMLNGINYIALTKLDVLSGFDKIKLCVGYDNEGKPIYEEVDGWNEDITNAKSFDEFPVKCQDYVKKLQSLLNTDVGVVSVGPKRNQTIIIKHIEENILEN
mgnify:CR=1 FL=1